MIVNHLIVPLQRIIINHHCYYLLYIMLLKLLKIEIDSSILREEILAGRYKIRKPSVSKDTKTF